MVSWTQTKGTVDQNPGTASASATFSTQTRTGNAYIVFVFWKTDVTISSMSDTQSNTYVSSVARLARPTDGYLQAWNVVSATGGDNPTVTVTWSGTPTSVDIYLVEIIGSHGTTMIGQTATGTATSGTTVTTGTFTPTYTNGAIIAFWTGDDGATALVDPIAGQTPLAVHLEPNWGTGIEMLTYTSSLGSNITAQGEFKNAITKAGIIALEIQAASQVYASTTTLSIDGQKFAINGVTKPIVYGVSYFDGIGWWQSDVLACAKNNVRIMRVLLDNPVPPFTAGERSIFNANGTLRVSEVARIHGLILTANFYGVLIDLCIHVADGDPNTADWITVAADRAAAVTNAANEFEQHAGILWDIVNEHNYGVEYDDVATELDALTDAFVAATSGQIWGVSGAFGTTDISYVLNDDLDTLRTSEIDALLARGGNIFRLHCGREFNWYLRLGVRARRLRNYLPANVPLYFDEEAREGSVESPGVVGAYEHRQAAQNAKGGGCAAYNKHTDATFDLRSGSMVSQFSAQELEAFNSFASPARGEVLPGRLRPRPFAPGHAR